MIKVLEHIFPRSAQGLRTYFAPQGTFLSLNIRPTPKFELTLPKSKDPILSKLNSTVLLVHPSYVAYQYVAFQRKQRCQQLLQLLQLTLHYLTYTTSYCLTFRKPNYPFTANLKRRLPAGSNLQVSPYSQYQSRDRNHKTNGHGFVRSMMQVPGRTLCSFTIRLDPPHHILFIQLGSSLAELLLRSLGLLSNFITDLRTKVGLKSLDCRLSSGLH